MNLSKGPSSYTKSDILLELGNLEYMFSPWRLECAKTFMKKHNFLRSVDIHTRTACYTKGREVQVIFRCTFRYLGVLSSYLDAQILLKNSSEGEIHLFKTTHTFTLLVYTFIMASEAVATTVKAIAKKEAAPSTTTLNSHPKLNEEET